VSIEIPKYTIQSNDTKTASKNKKILIALLLPVSFLIGYIGRGVYTEKTLKTLRERNDVLETSNSQYLDNLQQQKAELSLLKTEKKIKQEAIKQVQSKYKELIENQNALKSEIKFYERLLSPNAENKGLRVFAVKINKHPNNLFDLSVTLVQKIERAKIISGKVTIQVQGQLDGKNKVIAIEDADHSSYKFKYFQNITLIFSLPEGFIAEQLVVKLFPKTKKAKTIEHNIDWLSIINQDKNHV
jgi:hypothetical protein